MEFSYSKCRTLGNVSTVHCLLLEGRVHTCFVSWGIQCWAQNLRPGRLSKQHTYGMMFVEMLNTQYISRQWFIEENNSTYIYELILFSIMPTVKLWGTKIIKLLIHAYCGRDSTECSARCPNPWVGREKASKKMQFKKREVYYWLESGLSATTNTVARGQKKPWAEAVTQIYKVCISG